MSFFSLWHFHFNFWKLDVGKPIQLMINSLIKTWCTKLIQERLSPTCHSLKKCEQIWKFTLSLLIVLTNYYWNICKGEILRSQKMIICFIIAYKKFTLSSFIILTGVWKMQTSFQWFFNHEKTFSTHFMNSTTWTLQFWTGVI